MARLRSANRPPPARDGPLLHPNGSAYDMAVTAWLDVQLTVSEWESLSDREYQLSDRIQNGRIWMMKHRGHPRENHNRNLLAQLEADRHLLHMQIADRLLAIRVAVWSIWVCWQHFTSAERVRFGWECGLESIESPEDVWGRLALAGVEMGRLPVTERAYWWTNYRAERGENLAEWERAN